MADHSRKARELNTGFATLLLNTTVAETVSAKLNLASRAFLSDLRKEVRAIESESGITVAYGIEEICGVNAWSHAETKRWLEERGKELAIENAEKIGNTISMIDFIDKKVTNHDVKRMILYKVRDTDKGSFSKYVSKNILDSREVPKRDALGLPVPEIYYSVNEYWNAGRDFATKDLERMNGLIGGKILSMETNHQDRQHVMGTTIMGNDPRTPWWTATAARTTIQTCLSSAPT
jgi:choline dehydrogenase-like flavoprotein